jgi:hypothetical protein
MKHHVTCAICEKKAYITVGNGAEKKVGWLYFGKVNVNGCQTSKHFYKPKDRAKGFDVGNLEKVPNPCYDPNVKPKRVEYWECPKCASVGDNLSQTKVKE